MQPSRMVVSPALLACASEAPFFASHPNAIEDWKRYAISQWPNEACGFLMPDGSFKPARNVHEDPHNHFLIPPEDVLSSMGYVCVLHSHTYGPERHEDGRYKAPSPDPTMADMQGQVASAVAWGISLVNEEECSKPYFWGDQLPIQPLIGRVFQHGVADCYSLVRDWHRLRAINFAECPRDDDWWKAGPDFYQEGFAERGFVKVNRTIPMPGDGWLVKLRSEVYNHAVMYVGGGQIVHHCHAQLSQHSRAELWFSKCDFLLRHKDLPEVEADHVYC
jgi:cell wall-associated NlpC family hydrolase